MTSRIVSFAKFSFVLTVIAACTSEPAPHSAPDASTEDAFVPGDSSTDAGDAPELLDCRALVECRSACGLEDAESCLADCDDAASEGERALADALRSCMSSAFESCTLSFIPDGSCILETCAEAAGDCVAVEDELPDETLTCNELMHCLADCGEDTECAAGCHASASARANVLFDELMDCLRDPEHTAQCENEDDYEFFLCLDGLCSDANLACNQHVHGGDDEGESCQEIIDCFEAACQIPQIFDFACQLICLAGGSVNAQAEVIESGRELFSCAVAAFESCLISEGDLDEECAEAALAECPDWYTCP